jgi:hypothetical protein
LEAQLAALERYAADGNKEDTARDAEVERLHAEVRRDEAMIAALQVSYASPASRCR